MSTQQHDIETLIAQRTKLATAMADCDGDAFPGSKAWVAYSAAGRALKEFDAAHPEALAEIRARAAAARGPINYYM